MGNSSMSLHFSMDDNQPALDSIHFRSPLTQNVSISAYRGTQITVWGGEQCFRWTSAVCALSYLAVRYREMNGPMSTFPILQGYGGSMAASLDYALSKRPAWLVDVFGVTSKGDPNALRLFQRRNGCRKRSGPVEIRFNPHILSAEDIQIHLDGRLLSETHEIQALAIQLSSVWAVRFSRSKSGTDVMSRETVLAA
jgi:hypothetical protein